MQYFLGIDIGRSKHVAALLDAEGNDWETVALCCGKSWVHRAVRLSPGCGRGSRAQGDPRGHGGHGSLLADAVRSVTCRWDVILADALSKTEGFYTSATVGTPSIARPNQQKRPDPVGSGRSLLMGSGTETEG
jgi:hypothetical protein